MLKLIIGFLGYGLAVAHFYYSVGWYLDMRQLPDSAVKDYCKDWFLTRVTHGLLCAMATSFLVKWVL